MTRLVIQVTREITTYIGLQPLNCPGAQLLAHFDVQQVAQSPYGLGILAAWVAKGNYRKCELIGSGADWASNYRANSFSCFCGPVRKFQSVLYACEIVIVSCR